MLEKLLFLTNKFTRLQLFIINLLILFCICFLDYITGREIIFTLFYLFPIIGVVWFTGTIEGFIIAFLAAVIKISIDISMFSTYDTLWVPLWNDIVNSCLFFLIAGLLSSLRKSLLKEKGLSKMRNELLGMAAHDLKNPINGINLYAQYVKELLEKDFPETHIKYLNKISQLCSSMSYLINDILDFSNIENSSIKLNLVNYNYINIVEENVDFYNNLASKKEIDISIYCEKKEIIFPFDPLKIEQVLDNLLSNAIKFSNPKSSVKIEIHDLEDYVETLVIDEGIGIDEKEINNIFFPFSKTSTKPTAGEKSTGLGLAIVKKIIEAHKGSITVESILNKGSTFTFLLPKV